MNCCLSLQARTNEKPGSLLPLGLSSISVFFETQLAQDQGSAAPYHKQGRAGRESPGPVLSSLLAMTPSCLSPSGLAILSYSKRIHYSPRLASFPTVLSINIFVSIGPVLGSLSGGIVSFSCPYCSVLSESTYKVFLKASAL